MEYYESELSSFSMPAAPEAPRPRSTPEPVPVFIRQAAISLLLCILILSLRLWSPKGAALAKKWLVAGQQPSPVETAAHNMVDELLDGTPFSDAVVVFCQELIDVQMES